MAKTPEKEAAKREIIERSERYMKSRDKAELEAIQKLVDDLDDAFVLVVGQKDGINWSITFNPKGKTPEGIPSPFVDEESGEGV